MAGKPETFYSNNQFLSFGYAADPEKHRDFQSDRFFEINNCGMALMDADRPAMHDSPFETRYRSDHMIIWFSEGVGRLWLDDGPHTLQAGDLAYLPPHAAISFESAAESLHYWIHFSGNEASGMLADCGIDRCGIYRIGENPKIDNCFSEIAFRLTTRTGAAVLWCNGLFFQMLSLVADALLPDGDSADRSSIHPALKAMTLYYYESHPVEYYAELCGMGTSNFKHTFSKITHLTPVAYITSIRMEQARRLLLSPEASIKEIAYAVGYSDPLYFSRVFRKFYGVPPSEFAKHQTDAPAP